MRRHAVLAGALAVGVLLAGCSAGGSAGDRDAVPTTDHAAGWERPSPTPAPSPTDDPYSSLVATATTDEVEVFAEPDATGEPSHVFAHPTPIGAPRVFLVDDQRDDWLRVLLPVRPNGSTG